MSSRKRGLVTFHTPMPSTEWYQGLDGYTLASMKSLLFCHPADWTPWENPKDAPPPEVAVIPGPLTVLPGQIAVGSGGAGPEDGCKAKCLLKEGPGMGEGYERTKPWHPLYNLLIFPFFAWLYLRGAGVVSWREAAATALLWGTLTVVVDRGQGRWDPPGRHGRRGAGEWGRSWSSSPIV